MLTSGPTSQQQTRSSFELDTSDGDRNAVDPRPNSAPSCYQAHLDLAPWTNVIAGSRNYQSTNTFKDSTPHLKQVNSTYQRPSNISDGRLYEITESILVRIQDLEHYDRDHADTARLPSDSPDNTILEEDSNRPLYKKLEAALARVLVLERRRDICYRSAFKAVDSGECIVRGCGSKSSSPQNAIRHFSSTPTPEHEVAAIITQQTNCLQCEMHWRTPSGLAHHEETVHKETRSSRMVMFKPFFEQPHRKSLFLMAYELVFMKRRPYAYKSINGITAV